MEKAYDYINTIRFFKFLSIFNLTTIFWYLLKQAGLISCPKYSSSIAFLRGRRINIKIKIDKQTIGLHKRFD